MLKNFTFENFLSFKDKATFSFEAQANDKSHSESLVNIQGIDLLKSAVIFGPNASGKSNLSKAFVFFQQFVTQGLALANTPFLPAIPFALSTKTENQPSFFEVEIVKAKKRFIYGFEVTIKKVQREWLFEIVNNRKRKLFERKGNKTNSNIHYFKEATSDLKNKQTRDDVLLLSVLAAFNGQIASELVEEIKKITVFPADQKQLIIDYAFQNFENNKEEVLDLFKEANVGIKSFHLEQKEIKKEDFSNSLPPQLLPQMKDFMNASNGPFFQMKAFATHVKYDDEGNEKNDVSFDFMTQESTGTLQFLALSVWFVETLKQGKTLFIDELNASLHPFLCRLILKRFNSKEKNKNNAQLIFTTHDVSFLDHEILRRDQIWFTEKNKYEASKVYSLSDIGERKDLSYSKRYLEGRYGAIPYIKSLEVIDEI